MDIRILRYFLTVAKEQNFTHFCLNEIRRNTYGKEISCIF